MPHSGYSVACGSEHVEAGLRNLRHEVSVPTDLGHPSESLACRTAEHRLGAGKSTLWRWRGEKKEGGGREEGGEDRENKRGRRGDRRERRVRYGSQKSSRFVFL